MSIQKQKSILINQNLNTFINSFFKRESKDFLIGNTVCNIYKTKRVVHIPYFIKSGILNKHFVPSRRMGRVTLGKVVTSILEKRGVIKGPRGKGWEVEVRYIQLKYPYLDSSILSQFLAINANKYSFARLQKGLFNTVPIASSWSSYDDHILSENTTKVLPIGDRHGKRAMAGLKLELSGRLATQRNIPRKTVNNAYTGSLLKSRLDFNQYTAKNKLGTFTVKAWLSPRS